MGTWNSRGLRGSTLEEMVNWTNDHYLEKGTCPDSEDTDPHYTGAHGRRSQTDHTGVF